MQPYQDKEGEGPDSSTIHQLRVGPSWMDPIILFLKDDILPKEKWKANKV